MATDTVNKPSDFVFREKADGQLELVGDFEGLYKNFANPWNQSASDRSPMAQYYCFSRTQIVGAINRRVRTEGINRYPLGLEVGCGHGHVVDFLSRMTTVKFSGMDVSQVAIEHARTWLPQYKFEVGNITELMPPPSDGLYDIVVLGQVLWYVMHKMDTVMANCYRLMPFGGMLVVSQAFLHEPQRYGREIAEGFTGALKLLMRYPHLFELIEARFADGIIGGAPLNDGIFVLRRI